MFSAAPFFSAALVSLSAGVTPSFFASAPACLLTAAWSVTICFAKACTSLLLDLDCASLPASMSIWLAVTTMPAICGSEGPFPCASATLAQMVMAVARTSLMGVSPFTGIDDARRPCVPGLVAVELLGAHVGFGDADVGEHELHRHRHAGRPGEVVHRVAKLGDMALEHRAIDVAGLALPFRRRLRHRRDQAVVRVAPLQAVQLVEERGVLRAAIGVEQHDVMLQAAVRRVARHGEERRDADAAGEEHRGPPLVLV